MRSKLYPDNVIGKIKWNRNSFSRHWCETSVSFDRITYLYKIFAHIFSSRSGILNLDISCIEAHARQGVKAIEYQDISSFYNAAGRDESVAEMSKLFLSEPLNIWKSNNQNKKPAEKYFQSRFFLIILK